jgi:hypothetical protein
MSGGASPLCHSLCCQMEIEVIFCGELVQYAGTGGRVVHFRPKFALRSIGLVRVEYSCVNFGVDDDVHHLRIIIFLPSFFAYPLNHTLESFEFWFDLNFGLRDTESFPVDHNNFGGFFVIIDVVFGPVHEDGLEVSDWNIFFPVISNLALTKHSGVLIVESAYEGKSESPSAF